MCSVSAAVFLYSQVLLLPPEIELIKITQCDRQRPICGQCRKACIPCQGYRRPYAFRNFTMQDGRPPHAPLAPRKLDGDPVPDIAIPWPLMRSAYIEDMLGRFWEAYLPGGKQLDTQLAHHSTWGWVESMGLLLSQEDVSRKAAAALCLATVNVGENQQWLRENSLRYYTEALRDMATALNRPSKDGGVGLVSAIRIFSIYEVGKPCIDLFTLPIDNDF